MRSIKLLSDQAKEVLRSNPAKKTYDKEKHEKSMALRASRGETTYDFKGDKYSVDGVITTPSGARKVLRTGWQMRTLEGSSEEAPLLLSAYLK